MSYDPDSDGHPDRDLIDFPASSIWQRDYYDHGYSSHRPLPEDGYGRHNDICDVFTELDGAKQEIARLKEDVARCSRLIGELGKEVRALRSRPTTPKPPARPSRPQGSPSLGITESELNET